MSTDQTFDASLVSDSQAESAVEVQPVVEPLKYLSNWEAYDKLWEEDADITATYGGLASVLLGGMFFLGALSGIALIPMGFILRRVQKIGQLKRNLERLLEAFEADGVECLTELKVPGLSPLDLFVRFPSKNYFAIALRSQGKSKITYNEEKEAFFIRRLTSGRSVKPWTVDHVSQLRQQEHWLRRHHVEALFGKSAREKRKPLIKLLVITGETRLGTHPEHLYATIGNQKFLVLRKQGTVYILEETQLIPFIKAWLSESQATP